MPRRNSRSSQGQPLSVSTKVSCPKKYISQSWGEGDSRTNRSTVVTESHRLLTQVTRQKGTICLYPGTGNATDPKRGPYSMVSPLSQTPAQLCSPSPFPWISCRGCCCCLSVFLVAVATQFSRPPLTTPPQNSQAVLLLT